MTYCDECPLKGAPHASGVGNPHAKIAVVGRNPGKVEAQTGVPFTGPSGALLDATLDLAGLKRDDLYITNAVSCFVEGEGEEPTREMYDICHPRLVEELRAVKPELILSLGNEATKSLLGWQMGNIMSLVGSMHKLDDPPCWVIPTFHPAYILRGSTSGFYDFSSAVHRAKALTHGERPYPKPLPYDHIRYYDTQELVEKALEHLGMDEAPRCLGIDTETDAVRDPTRTILLLQLSNGEDAWVFEAKYMLEGKGYELFREMLLDPSRTWIFHNAEFDLQQLQAHWGVMPEHIEDTMALALCLSEKLEHCGLKRLVNTYLSVPHYEEELHRYLTHKNVGFSVIPREVLVPYAGFDAIFTYQLFPVLKQKVEEEGNGRLYPLLVDMQRLFAEMAFFGTLVDLSYVEELRAEYVPLRDKLELEMQAYAWEKGFRATEVVANAANWPFLNVRSPKQLLYFLNNYCGLKTKTTDRSFIDANEGHEFVDMLTEFRRVDHLMSVYIDGIADDVWPDGRVHPDFVHGTVTGRTTIQHPPLQTLPAPEFDENYGTKSIRRLFIVRPGYKWVHADYSQLEIRVAWHMSGDEALGTAVMAPDMHKAMAALAYRIPVEEVTKWQRARVKLVTFGMMYGRQAASIAKQLKCPVSEAQELLDSYEARFPKYFKWWREQQDSAVDSGVLETEFGRKERWPIITPEIEHRIRNQAANFAIQSTASDLTMRAFIKINKLLHERNWGRALFSVHDSVELEVREDVVEEAIPIILDIMEHPFEKSCAIFKVKAAFGDNLNEASK